MVISTRLGYGGRILDLIPGVLTGGGHNSQPRTSIVCGTAASTLWHVYSDEQDLFVK